MIYCKPKYSDLAKKLRDNYLDYHCGEIDIISEIEQDDIEYARENQYDEVIFIEDSNTVIISEIKSGCTNRCPISDVYYQDTKLDS